MPIVKPRTLSGFMELLPAPQQQMEKIMDTLRRTYALYGFTPLDTPLMEASEVLLAKGGGETEKQIYRFQKGDADLSLRFDLTVPLAKYVALHSHELVFPFRRYQIGKVYRGERAQRGRFREFYQADIDIIGDGTLSIINEAEIPAIIYRTFSALGLQNFHIRVNNRKILNGFYSMLDLTEKSGDIMRTVDKLEKIGAAKVHDILTDDFDIDAKDADAILHFLHISKNSDAVVGVAESMTGNKFDKAETVIRLLKDPLYYGRNALYDEGVNELETVVRYLDSFGVPADHFAVDLTIARGLDYYTGTVYETTLDEYPEIGSVCSGGRYDNLAEYYTDRKLPGVGISIGLTRLFYILQEKGLFNSDIPTAPADVLVIPMTDDLAPAISLATSFRENGVRVQLYCEGGKFKKKVGYADRLGVPYAVFMGEDEIRDGVVTCKDMATGEQTKLPADKTWPYIKAEMNRRKSGRLIMG